MTSLLRCRAAVSEMATLFDAKAERGLDWHPTIWPGEAAPVVIAKETGRHLRVLRWGLPEDVCVKATADAKRGTLFAREIAGGFSSPLLLNRLKRCLIVVEDVAYPQGQAGQRTRSWLGLWDRPLSAWAGLCVSDPATRGFAGFLTAANARAEPVTRTMPVLLHPSEWEAWLSGAALHQLDTAYDSDAFYLERTPEIWASGHLPENKRDVSRAPV
ncbi:hypothetical protein CP98_01991 [Sphingobium yanoikuyae]|uniref:DUF159 family protein n=1 Tax=Sphingobium yanoikuyae TaxID=13690 RepID=A0A084ENC8_SPHYA|nr:SOS response-associated peptidase family protein [Sphingobium yanoikuyae]KEZ19470.1 hypothetical protein CP98_01991 [Sphingobium yanoikuyae]